MPGYSCSCPSQSQASSWYARGSGDQLLYPIRPTRTFGLFGAIMAGYLANLLIPLGASPLVRSWLVARREGLNMSSVLATVVVDRLIDGVVFTGFVPIVLVFVAVPDPTGSMGSHGRELDVGALSHRPL